LTSRRREFYNSRGADFTQGVLNVMQTKLIITTAMLLGLAAPAHAQLFTPDGAFTVTSGGTPGVGGSDAATLTPGSAMTLTNAGLRSTQSACLPTSRCS
jgi:hypothetical protein